LSFWQFTWYLTVTVFAGYFCSLGLILLLPMDLAITKLRRCVELGDTRLMHLAGVDIISACGLSVICLSRRSAPLPLLSHDLLWQRGCDAGAV
jgi:hypothetical protein